METLEFEYRGGRTALTRNKPVLSGVLGSGNLEVLVEPADLGVDPRDATRNLLAARSMRDLVRASGGLYQPPKRFRNW